VKTLALQHQFKNSHVPVVTNSDIERHKLPGFVDVTKNIICLVFEFPCSKKWWNLCHNH